MRKRLLVFLSFTAGLTLLLVSMPAAAPAPPPRALGIPNLKWAYGGCSLASCQTGWYSSPAVANLDADTQLEVIGGAYDVVALDGVSGNVQWRAPGVNRVWPGIAVADLTADGDLEIVVGRAGDELTVYSHTGATEWSVHPFGLGEVRTVAVEDLEADGRQEVIVGRAGPGDTKQVHVFTATGAVRPGWPARHDGEPGQGWALYNENVVVADLNNDGFKEIIAPTDTSYITGLDRNGNQLRVNPIFSPRQFWSEVGVNVDQAADLRGFTNCGPEDRPNFGLSAPAVADMDGNGSLEIVVVGNVYDCLIGDPVGDLYHLPWIFRLDRTRWADSGFDWTVIPAAEPNSAPLSENYEVIENALPSAVTADLDGDGRKEILYASYDGRMHAFWLDKSEHGNWPFAIPGTGIRFGSEPVVADLDNDGRAEVLFTSWPEPGGARVGQLFVLDYLGNQIHSVILPLPRGNTWNGGLAAPTIANVDNDADMEVIMNTVSSGIVVYDLPGSASARILWGTGRGNFKRTGALPANLKKRRAQTISQ